MVLSKHYQVAEVEVIYMQHPSLRYKPKVKTAKQAYEAFIKTWNLRTIEYKEEFKVMLLNTTNQIIGIYHAHVGGTAGVYVDRKVIFTTALKANATSIIVAHNHPSGSVTPSKQDITQTRLLINAGKMLDVGIRDHLIITSYGYTSLADEGLLW